MNTTTMKNDCRPSSFSLTLQTFSCVQSHCRQSCCRYGYATVTGASAVVEESSRRRQSRYLFFLGALLSITLSSSLVPPSPSTRCLPSGHAASPLTAATTPHAHIHVPSEFHVTCSRPSRQPTHNQQPSRSDPERMVRLNECRNEPVAPASVCSR